LDTTLFLSRLAALLGLLWRCSDQKSISDVPFGVNAHCGQSGYPEVYSHGDCWCVLIASGVTVGLFGTQQVSLIDVVTTHLAAN
jgi:hypothetical protein